jgi:hypothetical protein
MKKKFVSLFLVLFLNFLSCLKISAQYQDPFMSPYWEFYSANVLSSVSAGKGNTGVASSGDVSMIYLNPAVLNIDKKFQINAGYNLRSGCAGQLTQNFYSFSIAGAYRLNKNFQIGFAYQNDYSFKYSPAIVFDYPETITFETHSFRIPAVYSNKWIRIGINFNLSLFKSSAYGCITESMWKIIPEFGTVITPIKDFSFGMSFIPGFTNYPDIINTCWGSESYTTFVKFPNRFKAGSEVRLFKNRLKLSLDYHYANTSSIKYLWDQRNFHFGLEYITNDIWTIRGGYFTILDYEDRTDKYWHDNSLYFLTIGATCKFNNYSFNIGCMGGMNSYEYERDYSVINFGAGYEF